MGLKNIQDADGGANTQLTPSETLINADKSKISAFKKHVLTVLMSTGIAFTWTDVLAQTTHNSWDKADNTTSISINNAKEAHTGEPEYTEKVIMPDGSVLMVSKEELNVLKELQDSWLYTDSKEMLNDFKMTVLSNRKIAILDEKEKEAKIETEQLIEKEKILDQIILEQTQKLAQNKEDIYIANTELKKIFESQLWKAIDSEELENYIKWYLLWNKSITSDGEIIRWIVKDKWVKWFLTKEQISKLTGLQKKWNTYNVLQVPFIINITHQFIETITQILNRWEQNLTYNK